MFIDLICLSVIGLPALYVYQFQAENRTLCYLDFYDFTPNVWLVSWVYLGIILNIVYKYHLLT